MQKQPCVYILATGVRGTLYIGVTSDLEKRIWEHRAHLVPGFTARYGVEQLVWFEIHDSMTAAIGREKQLKKWERMWKIELVETLNPEWRELAPWIEASGDK